jgi:hypothetical protein
VSEPDRTKNQVTISVGWLAFLLTGVAQIVGFTFFLARLEGGLSDVRNDVVRQSNEMNDLMQDLRRAEVQVQYLCNERRRDNQEEGRNGGAVC